MNLGASIRQLVHVPLPSRSRHGQRNLCSEMQANLSWGDAPESFWKTPSLTVKICLLFNHSLTHFASNFFFHKALIVPGKYPWNTVS